MTGQDTDAEAEQAPKPEEMGHPVPGAGAAIEPEALHTVADGG